MAAAFFNGFDAIRIDADGVRVPLNNETFNMDEVGGSSLGTIVSDDYGSIPDTEVASSDGIELEFSHDTYPEVFRRLLTATAEEAPLLRENAKTAYIAENLAGETQSVVAETWLRDDDNPDTPDVLLGYARQGETTTFPYETTGPTKNLTIFLQPISETGEKAHLRYEDGLSAPVVIDSSATDAADQAANTVFAGPTMGSAAAPTFRALVAADIPSLSGTYQPLDATLTALSAQNWAANAFPIGTGADTLSQVSFAANTFPARASTGNLVAKAISDNALSFVAAANYAAMRAALVPMTVGDAVSGGGINRVLYENGSQNLAADADFTFDGSNNRLTVGSLIVQTPNSTSFFLASAPHGSYTGTFNVFVGDSAGAGNTAFHSNTYVGSGAGSGTSVDAYFNTFIGRDAGKVCEGRSNTFIGYNTGVVNTSGANNVFVGQGAGAANVSGLNSTFVGYEAGTANTANNAAAFGYRAGFGNTSGTDNSFFGVLAGYQNVGGISNTFIGQRAGMANVSGNHCVFVGDNAGNSSTGDYNVMVGRTAGSNVTSGTNNCMIGYNVQADSATANSQTNINDTFIATATVARVMRPAFEVRYDGSNKVSISVSSAGLVDYDAVGASAKHRFNDDIELLEGKNMLIADGSGSQFGDGDAVMGWFGASPTAQPTTGVAAASFTANSGTAVNDASTFDGYTLKQVVKALRLLGFLQ